MCHTRRSFAARTLSREMLSRALQDLVGVLQWLNEEEAVDVMYLQVRRDVEAVTLTSIQY